jgi:hypothetical protein
MFVRDQDFVVDEQFGFIRCRGKTPQATSAFKVLQLQAQKLASHLPDGPAVEITADGVIGPSTALVVQMIALRVAEAGHGDLVEIGAAQPEEAIPAIAASAMEIAGYFERVLTTNPTAIIAPSPPEEPAFDPVQMLKQLFTGKRVAAIGGILLGLGSIAAIAGVSDRRALGRVDRSNLLPESDGTDEFDDDDDTDEYERKDEDETNEEVWDEPIPAVPKTGFIDVDEPEQPTTD